MRFKKLKKELKELAKEIRAKKSQRKGAQDGYVQGLINDSWEARHKHIAYCLLRGTPYERIEKPSKDNKPSQRKIRTYMDAALKSIPEFKQVVDEFQKACDKHGSALPFIIADIKAVKDRDAA